MAGFVENVNAVANAVNLATGDIVEDTTIARDEAVAAAKEATQSKEDAKYYEDFAHNWADKGHNNPVIGTVTDGTAEYSAYHWAVESALQVGDPLIDDTLISATHTWSSEKVNNSLLNKANSSHSHAGVYEPVFNKATAFNKNYAGTGSADTVARSDHNHANTYEPIITTKGTAFNKDFGTTSGTVAQGDHNHSTLYMPLATQNTAYNKNFVVDLNNPSSNEIPRGNHTHKAAGVSYDATGKKIITSTTVQGGMDQLDARLGTMSVAEKCYLTAGMTDPQYIVTIGTIGTPVVINAGTTIKTNRNAIYSGGIKINYATAPEKLVQGEFLCSLTFDAAANSVYTIRLAINGVVDTASKVLAVHGSATSPAGTFNVALSTFVMGLVNGDTIGVAISNDTAVSNITLRSMNVSFSGEPDGALVISGSSVLHNDVIGRDTANQHPTSSIYDSATSTSLDVLLNGKADLVPSPTANNLVAMDSAGELINSAVSISTVTGKMDKVASPTLDTIVVMDSVGNAKKGTKTIAQLASLNGDSLQNFDVKEATTTNHAVPKGQLDSTLANYATTTALSSHTTNTSNPHNTTYTQVGAAAAVHTHAISNITDLQTTLDGKYNKVVSPVTGNIAVFGAGNVLADGGPSVNTKINVTAITSVTFNADGTITIVTP